MRVRSKAETDFLRGLTSGSLALSLRSNVVISEENLKVGAIDEAEVRSKVQGQLLHSLDSGSLAAALKAEHPATSDIDVQQDNRSYSAVDSGEALAWNCSADCYAAFVVGCQKPPSPDVIFNKTQRDSTSTVNQEEMQVRSKAENDFLLGLTSGSLALSLCSNVVISEENLKVGAIDEAEVRSKVQSQLLHSLDSGSLTAALKTRHPAASVINVQQDDHLRSPLDSGEAPAWNCYA